MPDTNPETLELYKVYVDTINQNEAKRLQSNATYFGFAGALVAVVVAADLGDRDFVILSGLGFVLSVIWFFTIRHHRTLARSKFEVLQSMENELRHQPFQREWEIYKNSRWVISLTTLETAAPLILALCSIWLFIAKI